MNTHTETETDTAKYLPGEESAATAIAKYGEVATARFMRAEGASLFTIARAIGRSKEWLRTYAGLTDR